MLITKWAQFSCHHHPCLPVFNGHLTRTNCGHHTRRTRVVQAPATPLRVLTKRIRRACTIATCVGLRAPCSAKGLVFALSRGPRRHLPHWLRVMIATAAAIRGPGRARPRVVQPVGLAPLGLAPFEIAPLEIALPVIVPPFAAKFARLRTLRPPAGVRHHLAHPATPPCLLPQRASAPSCAPARRHLPSTTRPQSCTCSLPYTRSWQPTPTWWSLPVVRHLLRH